MDVLNCVCLNRSHRPLAWDRRDRGETRHGFSNWLCHAKPQKAENVTKYFVYLRSIVSFCCQPYVHYLIFSVYQ